eukprot:COSAG01_NODE_11561_length_1903_cov_1.876386_3_plen_145_part_00
MSQRPVPLLLLAALVAAISTRELLSPLPARPVAVPGPPQAADTVNVNMDDDVSNEPGPAADAGGGIVEEESADLSASLSQVGLGAPTASVLETCSRTNLTGAVVLVHVVARRCGGGIRGRYLRICPQRRGFRVSETLFTLCFMP